MWDKTVSVNRASNDQSRRNGAIGDNWTGSVVSHRSSSAYQQPLLLLRESFQVGYVLRNLLGGVQKCFTLLTLVVVQVLVDRTQLIALKYHQKEPKK